MKKGKEKEKITIAKAVAWRQWSAKEEECLGRVMGQGWGLSL